MKGKLFTRTLLLSLLISALLSFTACKSDEDKCKEGDLAACQQALAKGVLVDKRDGKMYKIVKIGSQTWMAENLNYKTQDSYCYDDNESNCSKYGRLYKWSATKKVCPNGWHLPSKTEFKILIKSTGGEKEFGINLKSKVGWDNGGKGTDAFGFSALPAGGRDDKGNYNFEGSLANFWSSTEVNSGDAYFIILNYGEDGAGLGYDYKYYGFSVRCLLDDSGLEKSAIDEPKTIGSKNSSTRTLVDKRDGKKYKTR